MHVLHLHTVAKDKGLPQKSFLREKFRPIFVHKSLRLEIWFGSPEDPKKQLLLKLFFKIRVRKFCNCLPGRKSEIMLQAS